MIDCHDGKIVAYGRLPSQRGARQPGCSPRRRRRCPTTPVRGPFRPGIPLPVARMAGAHGTLRADALNEREGLQPDNAAAEGFFGRMKTESVYPEHWEKRTRDEVLVLIDEYIHWVQPRAHQTVAGLDESGTISSKPRNGCMTISKKTSAAPSLGFEASFPAATEEKSHHLSPKTARH